MRLIACKNATFYIFAGHTFFFNEKWLVTFLPLFTKNHKIRIIILLDMTLLWHLNQAYWFALAAYQKPL